MLMYLIMANAVAICNEYHGEMKKGSEPRLEPHEKLILVPNRWPSHSGCNRMPSVPGRR